jgi:hypothetical protein
LVDEAPQQVLEFITRGRPRVRSQQDRPERASHWVCLDRLLSTTWPIAPRLSSTTTGSVLSDSSRRSLMSSIFFSWTIGDPLDERRLCSRQRNFGNDDPPPSPSTAPRGLPRNRRCPRPVSYISDVTEPHSVPPSGNPAPHNCIMSSTTRRMVDQVDRAASKTSPRFVRGCSCHPDGDAVSVDEQLECARAARVPAGLVEVRLHLDGVLVDVRQQILGS